MTFNICPSNRYCQITNILIITKKFSKLIVPRTSGWVIYFENRMTFWRDFQGKLLTYNTNKAFNCNRPLGSLLSLPQRPFCVVGRLGREKKKARGARWKGQREKRGLFPLPSSLARFLFFSLLLFLGGYPEGASAEERGFSNKATLFQAPR